MRAVVFESHGDLDVLEWSDWPDPVPGNDEVLVKVEAAALNGFDPMVLKGIPTLKTPLPMIPGGDVAGTVVQLGPDVSEGELEIGARVLVNPLQPGRGMMGETILGGFCEYVAVPYDSLVPIPEEVGFIDAAALPVAYGTAHRMMKRSKVTAEDKVLVLGATGGVGICCLQLAKLAGAEVTACTSSATKGERLLELGADHLIDTSHQDLGAAIREIWGKPKVYGESGGASLVVNYIGGESWAESLRTVCRGGRVVTCGATAGYDPPTDLRYIWSFELTVIGSNGWERDDLVSLIRQVASGRLSPVVDSVRSLSQAASAMKAMIDREVVGKVVLVP